VAEIEAVLFDFGGVFTVSPFSAARQAGDQLGLDLDTCIELCFGPYHEDTDHPWHRLERGEIALDDARRSLVELAARNGLDIDPFNLLGGLGLEDPQRQPVVERALSIRGAGLRTALVTNNVAEFGESWRGMVPVDDLFEVVIDSSRHGVRKPNPAIFLLALDALGVDPRDSVFLDDHPANVASAESLGMAGILVSDDRVAAFDRLDELLASRAG
jgi:putative hydrolase of the HAD superfamily